MGPWDDIAGGDAISADMETPVRKTYSGGKQSYFGPYKGPARNIIIRNIPMEIPFVHIIAVSPYFSGV
jgi:hypothetical protein